MTTAMHPQSDSIADLLDRHQAAQGLTDLQLANAIGYDKGLVVLMIKNRSMRLPINKAPALARALSLEPADVLRLVLTEQAPELLATFDEVFDPLKLTRTEVNLVKHLRRLTAGRQSAPIVFEGAGVIALVMAGQ
jgi:hypothetical protein